MHRLTPASLARNKFWADPGPHFGAGKFEVEVGCTEAGTSLSKSVSLSVCQYSICKMGIIAVPPPGVLLGAVTW